MLLRLRLKTRKRSNEADLGANMETMDVESEREAGRSAAFQEGIPRSG